MLHSTHCVLLDRSFEYNSSPFAARTHYNRSESELTITQVVSSAPVKSINLQQ